MTFWKKKKEIEKIIAPNELCNMTVSQGLKDEQTHPGREEQLDLSKYTDELS